VSVLRVGALCAGYAGLEMGLAQVLDVEHAFYFEHAAATEKNPKPTQAAARVLAYRFPGVPNLGDLTTADWATTAAIDILTAGFPCQDVSHAGRQAGMRDGNRSGLWFHIAEIINRLRPPLVVLENVRGLLSAEADSDMEPCTWCVGDESGVCLRALGCVLGDLADLGYDAEWTCLPASSVGAPHERERVFIVATYAAGIGRGEGWPEPAGQLGGSNAALSGDAAAHSDSATGGAQPVAIARGCDPTEPGHAGQEWAGYAPAIERWERILGRPAPAATVLGQRGGRQLSPAFVEFLMGLPGGWVADVPGLTRNQMLKVLGNGCVPQQVAAALRHLLPLLLDAQEVAA